MKLRDIIAEAFDMDAFKANFDKAAGEVDSERATQKVNYGKVNNEVSGVREYNTMLDIIGDKSKKVKQKERGATVDQEYPREVYNKMVNLGLLTPSLGLAPQLVDYLTWATSENMGDSTRRQAVNRNNPEEIAASEKMGNFPSVVNSDLSRLDAKEIRKMRDDGTADRDTRNYGKHREILINKINSMIPRVQSRLADRNRPR